ncbi:MAG: membrane integrity-associated transporter subunit PqiC [Acidobacteria bacterium]|nr:membrane integrity-associated transporter subunit PqiC [Acidobacteriota bacterium]
MIRGVWKLWFAAGLILGAAGCGGSIPKTHYYVLDFPAAAPQPRDPAPYTAAVMPFRAPGQLEQDRILYRPTPQEVGFYEYHRWADRPSSMLTSALVNRLRAQGVFRAVSLFDGRTKPDYLIRGRVERLDEVDSSGGVSVRVELLAELVEGKTGRTVWSGAGSHTGALTAGEVSAVVAEMGRGAEACLAEITAGLENFVKALPAPPAPASAVSR